MNSSFGLDFAKQRDMHYHQLRKKKKSSSAQDSAIAQIFAQQQAVELKQAKQIQKDMPPGLTTFWYKQRSTYQRKVKSGEEKRILLPYNMSPADVKQKYYKLRDKIGDTEDGRTIFFYLKQIFTKSGFCLSDSRLASICETFHLNKKQTPLTIEDDEIDNFFNSVLINSSDPGWRCVMYSSFKRNFWFTLPTRHEILLLARRYVFKPPPQLIKDTPFEPIRYRPNGDNEDKIQNKKKKQCRKRIRSKKRK